MNADEIVRALRCVQEKHRNDRLLTFQTDVSAMARDAADMIESLQAQLDEYDKEAKRQTNTIAEQHVLILELQGEIRRLQSAIINECDSCACEIANERDRLVREIDRLAAYEDTEEQGLLVRLPCKVGDTVYKHWKVGGKTEIGSALVTGFEIANDGINYCYRVKRFDRKETIKKFGKTVFLTRAEAEEALVKEGT